MVDLSEEAQLSYHQIVSKTLRSEEEGYEFYNSYAFDKGFSVRRCYAFDLQDDITIFRKKICTRLLHSKSNKSRIASYKLPIMKVQYLANNPEAKSSDGDAYVVDSQNAAKKSKKAPKDNSGNIKQKSGQSSQTPKKRGRPRKDAQKPTTSTNQNNTDSANIVAATKDHENRRVSLPSQFYMSPYRQP